MNSLNSGRVTYPVAYAEIAAVDTREAAAIIAGAAVRRQPLEVHLCNAYTLSLAQRDPRLLDALSRAHLNLPDGAPVAWLGRHVGTQGPVRGVDLVRETVRAGLPDRVSHYFYGGLGDVAQDAVARLQTDFPGLNVGGCEAPPLGEPDSSALDDLAVRLSDAKVQVIWVGLGTPLQDYVVPELARRTGSVVVPVGAAFDFLAGRVSEAPQLLHGTGLEWVYRLWREPRRLWRRYLLGNPRFIWAELRARRAR